MNTSHDIHANERLRQERIKRNWRQQDLAEHLGTAVGTIRRWERGSQQPSLYFRSKLCALFGKNAEELGLLPFEPSTAEDAPLETTFWSLPFMRNSFFTGRDRLLEQLHEALMHKSTRVALTQSYGIHGLGGIGKTQLAVEYAYRYRHAYNATLWVQAETQASLISSYARLAAVLKLPGQNEEDQNQMVATVLHWFNERKGWLLIFDNVEDLSLIKPFLPASDQGALLLTTRLQSLGSLARPIELPALTVQEGSAFLQNRIHRPGSGFEDAPHDQHEVEAAQAITLAMGGLPLALEQAGAYIDTIQCRISDYHQLFQQRQHRQLEEHEPSSDHPLSVSHTFLLSFFQVEQRNALAADLLTVCAFLAPEAIPEIFFQQGTLWPTPTLARMQADPLALSEALKALLSYSLLQRDASAGAVSIHRLVQMVVKGRLSEDEQHIWRRRIFVAMDVLFPTDEETQTDYLSRGEQLLAHAQASLLPFEPDQQDQVMYVSLMSRVAVYLSKRARYEEARPLFISLIRRAEQALGESHLLVAEAVSGLAGLYREQGRFSEAVSLGERALRIRQQNLDACHPLIADSLDQLGVLYKELANYAQAQEYYQQALYIREQSLDPQHPKRATSLFNLGFLYRIQRKYELAEPLLLQAVQIWEEALGPENRWIATSLTSLGTIYAERGDYEQSEAYHQRALRILKQAWGPEHPHVTTSLTNLGVLSFIQGNYEQALKYHQQALVILEQAWGPEHPRVACLLNNLGAVCYELGIYQPAEEYYQRALRIKEQALDPEHPEFAPTLTNLGEVYTQQGHYEQAEMYCRRAMHIWEQSLGPEHPDVAHALHALANVSREQGNYEQAEQLYQRTLLIRQKGLSPQHPDLADTLHELGYLYELQRRRTQARSFYQQAKTIRLHIYGPEHQKPQETQQALARLSPDLPDDN
ncbi:MAG TPA: FxSxx-COOH system tetratricopeptide repeat protein [Ktedonobacteraceae bacterium]|nr:FxSxx-COOH system tetratricopeptide repeat protein [Ktedonobacteraceae bacterium]